MRGEGFRLLHQSQRARRLSHDPRLPARHAGAQERHHRQHRLDRLLGHRGAEPVHLRHDQGRADRALQGRGGRFRDPGHPLQRHLPGHGGDAVAGAAHGGARRRGGGAQGLHRAPADGPPRQGGRDRRPGALSGVGRVRFRHRPGIRHRWRLDRRLSFIERI